MTDDELTPFSDDPLLRALTGPALPAELAAEAAALAAFRAARPAWRRRRMAARLGAGGSAFLAAAALSGGVAAASYTGSLPAPAQRVMSDVAGWAGVPAPPHQHHGGIASHGRPPGDREAPGRHGGPIGVPAAPPSAAASSPPRAGRPGSDRSPAAGPTQASDRHARAERPPGIHVRAPAAPTATPSAAAVPTGQPSPTPSLPVPSALSAAASSTRAPANATVTITGTLTAASGTPVPGRTVVLYERATGAGNSFHAAGAGTTDSDGTVSFGLPPLTRNVRVVLRSAGLRSSPLTVREIPLLSLTVTPDGANERVDLTSNGATPGDAVTLSQRRHGGWRAVGSSQLDAAGALSFEVPAPLHRPVHYRLVLVRTPTHTAAAMRFAISPA